MSPRPRSHARRAGPHQAFGALLHRLREAAGFSSAAALSKVAGLSTNYVSILERGESRPKSATIRRLAQAMALAASDRNALFAAAKLSGEPADVRAALAGLSIPGLEAWQHLPRLLAENVEHPTLAPGLLASDDVIIDATRAIGSLLAWLSLSLKPPTRGQRQQLLSFAHEVFSQSLALGKEYPTVYANWGPANAACDAASALPPAWRRELLSKRAAAERLTKLLGAWEYLCRGIPGPACLCIRFRAPELQQTYGINVVSWPFIVAVHDAMIAHRLWQELDLPTALGTSAKSSQQHDVAATLSPKNGDVFLVLNATPEGIEASRQADRERLVLAQQRVAFALRLFELPDLAADVLKHDRDELVAALTASAEWTGGIAPR